ncbi:unnamed protein product [Rhizoctonia solani]|uniref:Chitin-binding type-3 domain-containing protein n=1 Tax=Rhizoctonia solani TaxID=456999 RepID=A0A8H3GSV8_9AGAM|nr:unnamed protein product [Rhizoctonia solani]
MSSISEWRPDVPYTARSVVSHKGRKWTAKEWNENQEPGGASGVWIPNDGVWTEHVAHNAGDVVTYNNRKWTAKRWNENEKPGTSDAWIAS